MAASEETRAITNELLADPHYYLFDTLPAAGTTRFIVTNERELAAATFADIRYEPKATDDVYVNTEDLVDQVMENPVERPDIGFIFHHAFVCSTLLARCLNEIQAFFTLKEPWILRRLADIKRDHEGTIPADHWQLTMSAYVDLLAKQYKTGDSLIIKTTNVANNLLYEVFGYWPERPVLYMHSDIEAFLVSNLKKTKNTQQKMPVLLAGFVKDSDVRTKLGDMQIPPTLNLLQTCAMIWVANIYALKCAAERYGARQLKCLDMKTLLSQPADTLRAASCHFGHDPSDHDMVRMTSDEVMGKNAKDKRRRHNSRLKSKEDEQVLVANRDEIDAVIEWISPLVEELGLYGFLQERQLSVQ